MTSLVFFSKYETTPKEIKMHPTVTQSGMQSMSDEAWLYAL